MLVYGLEGFERKVHGVEAKRVKSVDLFRPSGLISIYRQGFKICGGPEEWLAHVLFELMYLKF